MPRSDFSVGGLLPLSLLAAVRDLIGDRPLPAEDVLLLKWLFAGPHLHR